MKERNRQQQEWMETITKRRVVAIVRGIYGEDVLRLSEALVRGGIGLVEVTFDQTGDPERTAAAICSIREQMGDRILAGAGTVMDLQQVRIAKEAGAAYIISPNVDGDVIAETGRLGMLSMPGALTPTEIAAAYEAGADIVKLFPASVLGPSYLKAVKAPLKHIPLMAVGGVNEENAAAFMAAGAVGVGVGGNLVSRKLVEEGRFEEIERIAAGLVRNVRGGQEQ